MRHYYDALMKLIYSIIILIALWFVFSSKDVKAQETTKSPQSIAVINIDSKGLESKMPLLISLVTLELERLGIYEVIDKYDVANHMKSNNIALDQPYGKTDLICIGGILKVDKILSGSAEKFGSKIIVVLRLVDVKEQRIEKAIVIAKY
jgi:TolB-like protein